MNERESNSNHAKVPNIPKATKPGRTINGIDESLYNKVVAKVGYPQRGRVHINTTLAIKLKKAGFSYKQIGMYMGVSGCTVKRRLKEAGLI